MMKTFLISGIFGLLAQSTFSQFATQLKPVEELLLEDLLGFGYQVFNIEYVGYENAYGKFSGGLNAVGMENGIIMTTGTILNNSNGPHGPNNSSSIGLSTDSGHDAIPAHLKHYVSNNLYLNDKPYDASRISFDFIADGNFVRFMYVFGSEEYNEFVSSNTNDYFIALLEGDDIVGGVVNIANVPGTQTPISVNTINNGYAALCTPPYGDSPINSNYYIDNCNSPFIQYDGMTLPLFAGAFIIPGKTYRLHLIVADAHDGLYDSGVFIQKGSFLVSNEEHTLNSLGISIYPNPVSEQFILSSAEPISSMYVTDISGKTHPVVFSQSSESIYTIPVENLSAGLYFLHVYADGKTITQKFVKQ